MNTIVDTGIALRQFKRHTKKLSNGDFVVGIQDGLFDLFVGDGFKNHSRFRIIKLRDRKERQLIQIAGTHIPRDYRDLLIKEV